MSLQDFQRAHRTFPEARTAPYGNRITVAASASEGAGVVTVHGRPKDGMGVGGLLNTAEARSLIASLTAAVEYAEEVAAQQRVASIPGLEAQLAQARSDAA